MKHSFTIFVDLEEVLFENFNISENNISSVEFAKVLTKVLDHVPSSQGYLNFITIVSLASNIYWNHKHLDSQLVTMMKIKENHWYGGIDFVTKCGLVLCKYLILLIMGIHSSF
jgi:hypothetical protein